MVKALEPYVAQAQASYPAATQRFLQGLPSGQTFFVTIRLTDSLNRHEQVFLAVDSIDTGRVVGRLWSEIAAVSGYRLGQRYEAKEPDIVDWMISQPDGTEEGNVVGKFLDTYQAPTTCREAVTSDR